MEHKSKKLKVSGSPKHGVAGGVNTGADASEAEWTTVEHKSKSSTLPLRPDISTPNAFTNLLQSGEKKADNNAEWSKVEKRKAKKARKVEENSENSPPRFYYVNSEIIKRREAVTIGDIRDLTLHLLGEAAPQPWLKVENRQAIRKVVVSFVPGILPEHLRIRYHPANATTNPNLPISIPLLQETNSAQQGMPVIVKTLFGGTKEIVPDIKDDTPKLPFVARTFSHACPTRAPGDALRMHSVLGAFFQGPISAEEKKRRMVASLKAGKDIAADDPMRYVLTPTQMLENEYPLPSYMKDASGGPEAGSSHSTDEGWKETPKPEENESGTPEVIAIDCEMCLTEDGKELTRVCAIDFRTGKVLLDKLVKPPKPIFDYLTRWSGINEESLRDVTATLQTVRDEFTDILSSSQGKTGRTPILLGHSLESDLRALKLAHSRCIDTALFYHHPRGRPLKPGLAWLTKKWCDREIQNRGEGGHDAEEDARACIELLERKLKGGPSFGEYKSTTEFESIFERLKRSIHGSSTGEPGSGTGAKLRTAVVDRGSPATWHGAGAGRCVACTNDDEVAKGILGCIEDSDFVWARLSGVAEAQNWLQPKSNTENSVQQNPLEADPATVENALKTLNSHLSLIHASLPPRTAFVVFTGHSDPRPMVALQARKNAFENALRASQASSSTSGSSVSVPEGVRWTASDARDLEEAVERARQGMLFLSLK
ncbi:uncharacterized protein FOMMEDRAFT_143323 [Fomitiporia mediterranea MF3/22]|uniref:uncharacterized protein n=1 Tax=Fomitiporia mediterranea (strain MF3/22) TaxID=694068 RepID=UPI0004409A62|nr:uncharacterized protein FOMMEDRAFT_143323 [Fomitiporia mediterranea MF3/22]EJC98240.1 hypothetical protein FOMMEDRAFT_143323 [Fomitiporia mediterranea MF3/22]